MIFTIVTGDWSDDGHGKSTDFYYKTDATLDELREAYLAGVKITGVDLFKECTEYCDRSLSEAATKYFDSPDCGSPEELATWVIDFIRLGNKDINITPVKSEVFNGYWCKNKKFNDGLGYGLF